jgi:biopolymer transport protein ExbD
MMASAGHHDKCEPNLTPLLDVVLQLVMFFMLCANFVMESVNENIKLPTAIEARALDKDVRDYIILNVDAKGVITVGNEVFETAPRVRGYLKNQFDLDKARTKPADWEAGRGRSVIILRAHKDCHYKQVNDVMDVCRAVGYYNVQLRAIKATTDS